MRLTPVSQPELIKRLRALGWEGPIFGHGKHPHMVKGEIVLTIPNPHGRDIGVHLLAVILREAGISRDEWLKRR